jgi:hypothetical protein
MLVTVKLGADFSRGCTGTRIGHVLLATHPRRPTLCTGTKFAPLSASITHGTLHKTFHEKNPFF